MASPVALWKNYTASDLRGLARRTWHTGQARRPLALPVIVDGRRRGDAAQVGDVRLQTIRDWVLQFKAKAPARLQTNLPPGRPPRLDAEHRAALARGIGDGPMSAVDGVVRWRLADLAQWLFEEFRVAIGETALGGVDWSSRGATSSPHEERTMPSTTNATGTP